MLARRHWSHGMFCPASAAVKANSYNKPDTLPSTEDLKASVEEEVNVYRSEFEKNAFKVFQLKQFVSCLILVLSSQGRYR